MSLLWLDNLLIPLPYIVVYQGEINTDSSNAQEYNYCYIEVLLFWSSVHLWFLLFSRPTLGGLLTSSYRQHQESLNAERERRRLEREERLQRIEREERNRFKFVTFLSIHFDAVCVFTQGYIISWIWQIHQHFQRHLVSLILEIAMINILSRSLKKQLRLTSKFFIRYLGVFLTGQVIASYYGHSNENCI